MWSVGVGMAPDHLSRPRVRDLDAVDRLAVFVAVRNLQSGPLRDDVGDIKDVGMAEAVGPERFPVVVNGDRAERHLLAAVAVEVVYVHAVCALAPHRRRRVVAEPAPCPDELSAGQIPGVDVHQGVGAARDQNALPFSVELRHADLIAVDAIAACVAPARRIAALDPVGARDLFARHAIQHDEILRAVEHEPAFCDDGFLPRGRVRRHLQRHFGLAVAVEIARDERRPPDAHVHVPSQIVPPHERASPPVVGLELERVWTRTNCAGIEPVPRARLLDDVIEHAIAVEVTDADTVELIVPLQLDRADAVGGSIRAE